ncbi:MAG: hypothetical protein HY699_25465 [Deltaproteobacteria bacterium]|nr:hypothetical protein [Deltaproteobacteria bacterium]
MAMNDYADNRWKDRPQVWEDRFALKVAYSFPPGHGLLAGARYPVLCFLHGDKECGRGPDKGKEIERAMSEHGPLLADESCSIARAKFIIVCPQLPYPGGDVWRNHCGAVLQIVRQMHEREQGDPTATYLAGFSYGGDGVFDIAAMGSDISWKALWGVDPTREPIGKPGCATWLSAGPRARAAKQAAAQPRL